MKPSWKLLVAASLVTACEARSNGTSAPPDVALVTPDAAPDTAPDALVDAPADASIDAPTDASIDAPADASVDAPADVTAPRDAALDATPDAPTDASVDSTSDARVTTLRVRYAPREGSLAVRGSLAPLDWMRGQPFRRVRDDTWEWTSPAPTAAFEWKPLLDDTTWSRGVNYRALPGVVTEVFPHFLGDAGEFSRAVPEFMSTVLNNRRGLWVYLPPGYRENTAARYPVVYLHDGQNLFDPRAAFGGVTWQADRAMNDGVVAGTIREAILVGVENTAARIAEYTPTVDATYGGGNGDAYLRMLVTEVKPYIDRTYRTLPDRANTAIVGSSLGGLISAYAGVRLADTFGLVGALSPSTWWNNRVILDEVATTPRRTSRPLRVYVDSGNAGTSNDGVDDTRMLAAAYRAAGYVEGTTLRYVVQEGAQHSEAYWAMRLPGALAFLLGGQQP